ncbi:hypothetical protein K8I61_12180 [bacterium]|nr:hypothetical protein [bacterium]
MIRNVIVILIGAAIAAAGAWVAFAPIDVADVMPANTGMIVQLPDLARTAEMLIASDSFRVLTELGIGGQQLALGVGILDAVRAKPFAWDAIRFFQPVVSVMTPADVASWTDPDAVPRLFVIDLGRPIVFLSMLGLDIISARADKTAEHLGHPIYESDKLRLARVRNLIVIGGSSEVKDAISAFKGLLPSAAVEHGDRLAAARGLLSGPADVRALVLTPTAIISGESGSATQKFFAAESDFAGGALQLRLEGDAIRGEAILKAKPGKAVVRQFAAKSTDDPWALRRFLNDDRAYTAGIRSGELGDLADAFLTLLVPTQAMGDNKLREKLSALLVREVLAGVGPEVIFSRDKEGEWFVVAQVKDETIFRKTVENLRNPPLHSSQKKYLEEAFGAAESLREALRTQKHFSVANANRYIGTLPEAEQEAARPRLEEALGDLAGVLADGGPVRMMLYDKPYFLDLHAGLLLMSTTPSGVEILRATPPEPPRSRIEIFLDGGPRGGAFFALNVTDYVHRALPGLQYGRDLARIFRRPWLAVADIHDETSRLRVTGGLDAYLGLADFKPRGFTFWLALFHIARWLLAALVLYCAFAATRRVVRIARGQVPSPKKEKAPKRKRTK